MRVSYQNVIPNITDFMLNGKIVAVIGYSGGLTFVRGIELSIEEIEAIEELAISRIKSI